MTAPAVVAQHLTKVFGEQRGISDVNLTIEPGQVFGFLGPNGAGKTTTIRCLLGLYRPTSGHAQVLGRDPASDAATFLADVGYLPGELSLPGTLTGEDLIGRFSRIRGLTDTAYRHELVERFGAELTRPLRTLSKGNKQKIGIVLTFMHRPRLLVLDEPTSGLDPLLQDEFATLLRETVDQGQTVLLSSHDLEEVQRVVERLAIIKAGHIVVEDTVEGLRASAPRTIELGFDHDTSHDIDHDVDMAPLRALAQVTIHSETARHLVLTHTGSAAPVLSAIARLGPETITARPADLEELFLRLYVDEKEEPRAR